MLYNETFGFLIRRSQVRILSGVFINSYKIMTYKTNSSLNFARNRRCAKVRQKECITGTKKGLRAILVSIRSQPRNPLLGCSDSFMACSISSGLLILTQPLLTHNAHVSQVDAIVTIHIGVFDTPCSRNKVVVFGFANPVAACRAGSAPAQCVG